MISVKYDSIKTICQEQIGDKYLKQIQSFYNRIAQLTVQIDTFNCLIFDYFEQVLELNMEFFQNKKNQNSDETTKKKDDSGAIAATIKYVDQFPNISIYRQYDNFDKTFYSRMYHPQLLMPFRERVSSFSAFLLNTPKIKALIYDT